MLTKINNTTNDMNTVASDAINSYIKDGYRIDAKESVINPSDKDCTFKAVLTKDVDGIECKATIKLNENKDDNSHSCTYTKVETVGDTTWSKETRSFSTSTGNVKNKSTRKRPSAFKSLDDIIKIPVKSENSDKDNTNKATKDKDLENKSKDWLASNDDIDDYEDDLTKLVRLIFGHAYK